MGGARRWQKFVPTFTKSTLDLADLCARELWRGKNYQTNKPTFSDEYFFTLLSNPVYKKVFDLKNPSIKPITIGDLKEFINVAVPAMNLSTNSADYATGIKKLNRDIPLQVKQTIGKSHDNNPYDLAENLIDQLGDDFHTVSNKSFLILASRVLFFATPHLPIFNFSEPLVKALGLPSKQDVSFPIFNDLMRLGLEDNWEMLKIYQMPFLSNKEQDERMWQIARDSGWWQRRILDLACVITLTNTTPKLFLANLNKTLPNKPI